MRVRPTRVVSHDAVLALDHAWANGGGPLVTFVHATGFCKEVWDPTLDDLGASGLGFAATRMDQRAHGGSSGAGVKSWWQLGRDVLAAVGGRRGVIGVGHSSGGAALVLAELLEPGTFGCLLLIEPIVPPPPFERDEAHPLAELALKRRRAFPDAATAIESYRGRGPFANWEERSLHAYVRGAFVASAEGVTLACDPADEADFYRAAGEHGAWGRLGELSVPTRVIYGADTTDFYPGFFADVASRIPGASITAIEEASHFVPMERPGDVADHIAVAVSEYGKPPGRS